MPPAHAASWRLTADALETGKRACQEAGMDGFLTKPVDPAELEEMFLTLFPYEEDCRILSRHDASPPHAIPSANI